MQLRREGVDAWIDQFAEDDPPYWPTWMFQQIEQADFVLCVVSEVYRDRFDADKRLDSGKGVNWEGLVLTEASYRDLPDAHRKFIAVAFERSDLQYVPRIFLGAGRTAYVLPHAYDALYRRLSGQLRKVPELGAVRQLSALHHDREEASALHVRSRPPFVTTRFLNRERETRQLREEIDRDSSRCVILTGRPGIGKTALVGRLLEFLEGQHSTVPVTFSYLPADGSVPLSPDLIRAHLGERIPSARSEAAREILVIDQGEALLDGECDWLSAELGGHLLDLAARPRFRLIFVSRRQPNSRAASPEQRTVIPLRSGLPPAEARQMLLDADTDGRLGLRDSRGAVEQFVDKADGNPRALELIIAALAEDPLLAPETLVSDLTDATDVAAQLLGDTYRDLDAHERQLVAILAVAGSAVPIAVLRRVADDDPELEDVVRRLALKEVVKVDRIGSRVLLDAFDAAYASRHVVDPAMRQPLHRKIASAASAVIDADGLHGSEADTWAIGAVEHFLAAGDIGQAALTLDHAQTRSLEPRGVYDQVIRLRKRLIDTEDEAASNRVALVRLLYLTGRGDEARELIERTDPLFDNERWQPDCAAWNTATAHVFGDLDEPREAMSRYRRAVAQATPVVVVARALSGAAQLARRRGHLAISQHWLDRAMRLIEENDGQPDATTCQVHALALHQLGQLARFRSEHRDAEHLVARALKISEETEDRGGIAYRLCLQAALRSDRFELDEAQRTLQFALGLYDEIGDAWGTAAAALALASVETDRGDYDRASNHLRTAVDHAGRTHNTRVTHVAHGVRLTIERRQGTIRPETRSLALRAVEALEATGFHLYAGRVERELRLHDLVMGADHEHDTDPVASLLRLGRPLAQVLPRAGHLPIGFCDDIDRLAAGARASLRAPLRPGTP